MLLPICYTRKGKFFRCMYVYVRMYVSVFNAEHRQSGQNTAQLLYPRCIHGIPHPSTTSFYIEWSSGLADVRHWVCQYAATIHKASSPINFILAASLKGIIFQSARVVHWVMMNHLLKWFRAAKILCNRLRLMLGKHGTEITTEGMYKSNKFFYHLLRTRSIEIRFCVW